VRRRRASQVVGVLVGSALFAGFFFTPALPAFFSAEVFAQGPTGMSKRELFYATTMERLRDPTAYSQAVAAAPESNRNLLLLGSSELSSPAPQNPARFFPHHVSDFDLFISGRGYTQSLYQAISLSATASQTPMKKVALIVSPQWFTRDGELPEAFQDVFSAEDYNRMLGDSSLSDDLRQRIVARADALRQVSSQPVARLDRVELAVGGRVGLAKSAIEGAGYTAPYSVAEGSVPASQVDWDAHLAQATQEGAAASSNDLNIEDNYYKTYVEPALEKSKGSMSTLDYSADSPEYGDLNLFLEVAKAHGIEVMLISVPVHGKWYDYTGYPAERRAQYYEKIRQLAAQHGARLADFSSHEYDPYFLYDVMHLGWKGWLYVNQACVDFATS
jgi:hypothetical protein